jgi:hypothetical protein
MYPPTLMTACAAPAGELSPIPIRSNAFRDVRKMTADRAWSTRARAKPRQQWSPDITANGDFDGFTFD